VGGALSSDFGPLLLRALTSRSACTHRLAETFDDQRHASYTEHPLRHLLAQRIYQIACGYEDGNDANTLRTDAVAARHGERSEGAQSPGGVGSRTGAGTLAPAVRPQLSP
jgi:hypothetical protein